MISGFIFIHLYTASIAFLNDQKTPRSLKIIVFYNCAGSDSIRNMACMKATDYRFTGVTALRKKLVHSAFWKAALRAKNKATRKQPVVVMSRKIRNFQDTNTYVESIRLATFDFHLFLFSFSIYLVGFISLGYCKQLLRTSSAHRNSVNSSNPNLLPFSG